jgi:hypothetical protein
MGLEGESTKEVNLQPVPVSTKRDRSSGPADSGKKVLPGLEAVREAL